MNKSKKKTLKNTSREEAEKGIHRTARKCAKKKTEKITVCSDSHNWKADYSLPPKKKVVNCSGGRWEEREG